MTGAEAQVAREQKQERNVMMQQLVALAGKYQHRYELPTTVQNDVDMFFKQRDADMTPANVA